MMATIGGKAAHFPWEELQTAPEPTEGECLAIGRKRVIDRST